MATSLFPMSTPPPAATTTACGKVLLPVGYVPSPLDVWIGRGQKVRDHNTSFYAVIESELPHYVAAGNHKRSKTEILSRTLIRIHEMGGLFVKEDLTAMNVGCGGKRWVVVEDSVARSTISQSFRDALDTRYSSSKQAKQRKRTQKRKKYCSSSSPASPKTTTTVSYEDDDDSSVLWSELNSLPFFEVDDCPPSNKRARPSSCVSNEDILNSIIQRPATDPTKLFESLQGMDDLIDHPDWEQPQDNGLSAWYKEANILPKDVDDLFSPALFSVFDDDEDDTSSKRMTGVSAHPKANQSKHLYSGKSAGDETAMTAREWLIALNSLRKH